MGDQAVLSLCHLFAQTLSPSREQIQAAEAQLKEASKQPGYGITLLKVTATDSVDVSVRQAAAVSFKNLVKYRWSTSDADAYAGVQVIQDVEKGQIKGLLPSLMLSTPPLVRAQLSEALTIISTQDFPHKWPRLLPELKEKLVGGDLSVVNGVFQTANSIFKRYRNQMGTNEMIEELEQSQKAFASVALESLQRMSSLVPQYQGDLEQLKLVLSTVRLICRIFFSLNSPGLTELIESQLDAWMNEFHTYLSYENPALDEKDPEKESVLDGVKSAITQNINLLFYRDEEDFAKFLQTFITDVWGLLVKVSPRPGQDNLAMHAIRFLTTVSSSVHHTLFADPNVLKQICESIVIPNLRARDEDEELFDMNGVEYIRRDTEGSDTDTRRRSAAELVKALTEKFPKAVTEMLTGYVSAMLAEYAQSPDTNWKPKDCAMYLVLALTVRGKTGAQGATTTNQLVNVLDFYQQQVLPELQDTDINRRPILKADALKFITTFRSQLPKDMCIAVFPNIIKLLRAESFVVHSYAAIAVERWLALKEGGRPRYQPADLAAYLPSLLDALFSAFKLPDSSENEYVMKCVMRVITFVGKEIAPVAAQCLQALSQILLEVCKNPKNPGFNHYLFESVAALIKEGTAASGDMVVTFESMLFPAFEHVLQQDVQEFHPYVFQIFAQLIELRSAPLPAVYLQIFPGLLSPMFWERSGNVPGLVRLLQAYLSKAPSEIIAGNHLTGVLGVFQKLVASKAHDHEGFYILNAIVESLPLDSYQQYLPTVWQILFTRLQTSKTPKYTQCFLVFLCLFVCKLGPVVAMESVDQVQPGIFLMLLQQVWIPSMVNVEGFEEEKLLAVATTKCLTECPAVYQNQALWAQLHEALVQKMEGRSQNIASLPVDDEVEEMSGYTAFAKLANAVQPPREVLAEVVDPKQYVQGSLAQFRSKVTGS